MKNRDKKIKKNAAHYDRYLLDESFVGEKKNGATDAFRRSSSYHNTSEIQNDLHTQYTKMERKMNQNGTGSRLFHFGIYVLYDKKHFGFHWYYGTSWRYDNHTCGISI